MRQYSQSPAGGRWRRPSWLAWLLLAGVVTAFVALGLWQSGRGDDKQQRLDALAQVVAQPARDLTAADLAAAGGYDRVAASGSWLSPVYLLDNVVREGRAGAEVYRPLRLAGGDTLLVLLGWLPLAADRRAPPEVPDLDALPASVQGLLAPPPAIGLRLGGDWRDAPAPKLMPYLDLAEVSADLGAPLAPRILRGDASMPIDGLLPPVLQPSLGLPPARHRAYAWQWWSLAIAVCLVFIVVHRPRRSP